MTGRLTAPFFRANNMISVGVPVEQLPLLQLYL